MSKSNTAFSMAWFVIVIGVTVFVILFGPRRYRSESRLLLRLGRENVAVDPTASTGEVLHVQTNRDSEVKTILGILASRDIALEVVDEIGPEPINTGYLSEGDGVPSKSFVSLCLSNLKALASGLDPISPEESALKALYSGIRFDATDRQSNVVLVEYRAKSPALAQRVVELWVESFLKLHPKTNRAKGSLDFFREQLRELEQKLAEARVEFREAKNDATILSLVSQQEAMSQRVAATKLREAELVSSLAAAAMKTEKLREMIDGTEREIVLEERMGLANAAADGMRQQLYDLQIQEKGIASSYTAGHPMRQAIQSQLRDVSKIMDATEEGRRETVAGSNPAYWRLQEQFVLEAANQSAVGAELNAVRQTWSGLESDLKELNAREGEIRTKGQQVEILELRYAGLHAKMEEARIDEELQNQRITSINVIQSPSLEQQPVSPRKTLCAVIGLFAAFAGAISPWLLTTPAPKTSGKEKRVRTGLRRDRKNSITGTDRSGAIPR